MLKGVAEAVTNALIPSPDELGRVSQRFVVILGRYSDCDENSLLMISLASSKLTLEADKPIITLAAQTLLTFTTRDHKPLTGDIPRAKSERRLCNVRAIATRILLVEIAAVTYPYGRRAGH